MIFQVRDCAKTKLLCAVSQHHECVSVVESKRFGHADAGSSELIRDLLERQFIASFQNFLRNRAGVLRINIDLSATERLPKNDRAAHSLPVFNGNSGVTQTALRNFAEDIRLGEFLGADHDRFGRQRTRRKNKESRDAGKKKQASEGFLFSCFPNSVHKTARLRCALMNSETKGLAGFSRRSASEPCWTIRPSFTSTISSPR